MVKGLGHCGLSTRDMEKSIWFYTEVLEGRIIMEIDEPKGTPWIVAIQYEDGTIMELFYPRPEQFPLGTELGRNHVCFVVDDIYALQDKLKANGVNVTSEAKIVRDGNLQVWCEDPNGYKVEFMQYLPGCPQLTKGPKVHLW